MRPPKRLTLLRHAKALQADGSVTDKDRPLSERGEQDAPLMGRRLKERGARPSLILTSPARRALATARLVAEELGYPREFLQREADLYLATPEEILAVIGRQDDAFNDIMVCGHNPGLTELARQLGGNDIDSMPTCGVVVIEARIRQWHDLPAGGHLAWSDCPRNARTPAAADR